MKIEFMTKLLKIKSWTILRLPEGVSMQLPSRGMVMVSGLMNEIAFKSVLEPDGRYLSGKHPSHWFKVNQELLERIGVKAGDNVKISLEPTQDWIEPEIPKDLIVALKKSPKAKLTWEKLTPLARWDWIRWIRAVKTSETRQNHIQIAVDKLIKGTRKPCCFNRNLCSEPYVSRNWVLNNPD